MTTLQDLITQVRERTNTEVNQVITDSELTYYLNASGGELDDILVSKQQDYRLTNTIVTITTGNLIPLPSDFYQLRQVDFYYNPNISYPWMTLKPFMLKEQTSYSNTFTRSIMGFPDLRYMLQDSNIAIVPELIALGQYRVWYTPVFTTLVNTTDPIPTFWDNQAWREYIVTDCAIKVYNKQQLDPSGFMVEKDALLKRISSMAAKRDAGSPKHIVNMRHQNGYGVYGYGYRGGYGGGFF